MSKNIYTSASYFFLGSELIRIISAIFISIFLAYKLGPALMGISITCSLLLRYASFTQLGLLQGYSLQALEYLKDKKTEPFNEISDICLTSIAINLMFFGFIFWTLCIYLNIEYIFVEGFLAYSVATIFFQIFNIQEARLKFQNYFFIVSIGQVLVPLSQLILILLLIDFLSIRGVFIAISLCYLPSIILFLIFGAIINFKINLIKSTSMIKIGFPIFLCTSIPGFALQLEKIFVANTFSITQVGIFGAIASFAIIISNFGQKLSSLIFQSTLKSTNITFEESVDKTLEILQKLLPLMILLLFSASLYLTILIEILLIDYKEGLSLIPIMMLWVLQMIIYWVIFANYSAFQKNNILIFAQIIGLVMSLSFFLGLMLFESSKLFYFALPNIIYVSTSLSIFGFVSKKTEMKNLILIINIIIISMLFIFTSNLDILTIFYTNFYLFYFSTFVATIISLLSILKFFKFYGLSLTQR